MKKSKINIQSYRCMICNNPINTTDSDTYWFILFENTDKPNNNKSYIHNNCFYELDFDNKQNMFSNAAIKGNLPSDYMYSQALHILKEQKRSITILTENLATIEHELSLYRYITKWHKFNKLNQSTYPIISQEYWVTLTNGSVASVIFEQGKFNKHEEDIVAWAVRLVPEQFNTLCYSSILSAVKTYTTNVTGGVS